MEQSKIFYENSTRQLVNILECLSSQLTSSSNCSTRHCSNDNNLDSDSFDSLLSRRSHDLSLRHSIDSYQQMPLGAGVTMTTASTANNIDPPLYENILYDSHHQGANQSALGTEEDDTDHHDQASNLQKSKSYGRSDSLSSVFLPSAVPSREIRVSTAAGVRENVTTRNRSVMRQF